jgi:uncharacterized protein YegP (UPF0339 family)
LCGSGAPEAKVAAGQDPGQTRRIVMAGLFAVFVDAESHFRFLLKAPDGTTRAVSRDFDDKPAPVAGIAARA